MILNTYRIQSMGKVREALLARGGPSYFDITALSLRSAWSKFCKQRFKPHQLPDADDYDVSLLRRDVANEILKSRGVQS